MCSPIAHHKNHSTLISMPLKLNLDFVTLKQHGEDKSSQTYFLHVKTPAEKHNPVKIFNYIFNNCFAADNADEANIEDQTT